MNLFRTIKPVVKRSNLSLKMRLIEGVTEVCFARKESFNDKFNEKYIKYPIHYKIPCIYLKPITDIEKLNQTYP